MWTPIPSNDDDVDAEAKKTLSAIFNEEIQQWSQFVSDGKIESPYMKKQHHGEGRESEG